MFYIQVFKSGELSELANSLWSRNLPILADRGLILDRNGVVLADNITTTSVVVIPNQINDKEKVSSELAKILNTDYENVFKFVNKKVRLKESIPMVGDLVMK